MAGWLVGRVACDLAAPDSARYTFPHLHTMSVADVDDVAGSDALVARFLEPPKNRKFSGHLWGLEANARGAVY